MSHQHESPRGAARRAAPPVVLRWAVLLAVLTWVLPVCAHAVGGALPALAAPPAATAVSEAASDRSADAHLCSGEEHAPGDAHCRPATDVAATTASPVPVPSPQVTGMAVAARAPEAPAARGTPDVPARTPGIHQLQVQRT